MSTFKPRSSTVISNKAGNDTDCTLEEKGWFNAVANKKKVLQFAASYNGPRNLHCLDLFGASGEVAAKWQKNGKKAAVYDLKINGEANDICSEEGFWNLMTMACSLKPGGLVMAGPPCSLFIFLSSSVHRRGRGKPWGNTKLASVRLSNRIVANMSVVLEAAIARGAHVVVEQPMSSQMWSLPPLKKVITDQNWKRCFTYMGAFRHAMKKPTVLMGTLPTLMQMRRTLPNSPRFRKASQKFYVKSKFNGKKNVQGTKALQGSAAYTATFCESLFRNWAKATC